MTTYDVALFGANGFIATHLIEYFNQTKKQYLVLGRTCPAFVPPDRFIKADLADPKLGQKLMSLSHLKIGTLIFNSAIKGRFQPDSPDWTQQGIVSSPDFINGPIQHLKFEKLITMGSSEEYGPRTSPVKIRETEAPLPISSYGHWKSKLYQNGLFWQHATQKDFVHLRPFNVLGQGADQNMFVSLLIRHLLKNDEFKMTLGEQFRSFLSVKTLIKTIDALLSQPEHAVALPGHALNVSEPHYLQLQEMAQLILKKITQGKINFGALPYRSDEVWHQNPDLTQLQKILGPSYAQDINTTLNDTITSIRNQTL